VSDAQIPEDDLKALEREVGDLLAEAESLGDQLAAEVGSSSSAPPQQAKKPQSDALADEEVTERLAKVESALQDTAADLGADRASPSKPRKINLPPKSAARPPQNEPKLAAASAAPVAEPAKPQGPRHAIEAGGKPAVVAPGKRKTLAGAADVERLVGARVPQAPVDLPARPKLLERIRALLPGAAVRRAYTRGMARTVIALEWLDRPFQRIGYRARALLGWCALIMFTAALALYVFVVR
jgi:hypothetical protein